MARPPPACHPPWRPRWRRGSASPIPPCPGTATAAGRSRWPRRSAPRPARRPRSRATSRCWPRARSPRCARAARDVAARRRWPTSATPSRRSRCWPAPRRSPAWWPRCSRSWTASTSARPAAGRPSGRPCAGCCAPRAPPSPGCATCSSAWRSTAPAWRPTSPPSWATPPAPRRGPRRSPRPARSSTARSPRTAEAEAVAVLPHHEDRGPRDGAPLLLAGSLGTTLRVWDPQLEALHARGIRTIAYDQRGHGASPEPPGPYAIADLGADALALLDHLELPSAAFAGLSIGGMAGQWLAAHAPERVARLVLLCTTAHLPPAERWHARAATVRAAGTVDVIADAVVAGWLTPAFTAAHPETVAGLRAMLAASPPAGYAACCEA